MYHILWISRWIATARERIPGSIENYVTGVSERSQQRGNLKDNGYKCFFAYIWLLCHKITTLSDKFLSSLSQPAGLTSIAIGSTWLCLEGIWTNSNQKMNKEQITSLGQIPQIAVLHARVSH
ncbi:MULTISPECIES: hypothetical protein [Photorhabdus]|uniref:hypothetical protein n=1 Tax=Photorhabdus TaxID=29487 RepID=UPI000F61F911|nr:MULTISPECIES: hypothetical protein [Photorhabdus]MCZ1247618.1 hypothetical protein [Photorhabdus laumondii subsp. laumondii]NDK95179.1 hypothetical protein [Photorhabdus laumondii subsp. laumondii]NDL50002.1 hypothetical protein [Photorhabdus laumondii subsp. laumondii]